MVAQRGGRLPHGLMSSAAAALPASPRCSAPQAVNIPAANWDWGVSSCLRVAYSYVIACQLGGVCYAGMIFVDFLRSSYWL